MTSGIALIVTVDLASSGKSVEDAALALSKSLSASASDATRASIAVYGSDQLDVRLTGRQASSIDVSRSVRAAADSLGNVRMMRIDSDERFSQIASGALAASRPGTTAVVASFPSAPGSALSSEATTLRAAARRGGFTVWSVAHVGHLTRLTVVGEGGSAFLLALVSQRPFSVRDKASLATFDTTLVSSN